MALFQKQQEFLDFAYAWLRAADAEYDAALAKYRAATNDLTRRWAMQDMEVAHNKRAVAHGGETGCGKTPVALHVALTKGRETKRPSIWFTNKSLIGQTMQELLERSRSGDIPAIHPLQIVPVMGSAATKRRILERVKSLEGRGYLFVIMNPHGGRLPAGEKGVGGPPDEMRGKGRVPDEEAGEDDDEYGEEEIEDQAAVNKLLHEIHWSCAVIDEPQNHIASNATRNFKEVFAPLRADWKVALSATIFPYKPLQYATIVDYLQPGRFFSSKASFVRDNFITESGRVKKILPRWSTLWEALNRELIFTCKLDQVTELPPVTYDVMKVELYEPQRHAYRALTANFIEWLDTLSAEGGYTRIPLQNVLTKLLRFKQVCFSLNLMKQSVARSHDELLRGIAFAHREGEDSAKLDRLLQEVVWNLRPYEKYVIYSQWSESARMIAALLNGKGLATGLITGDTPATVQVHADGITGPRIQACEDHNYGRLEGTVITDAVAEGLNLQRANHLFMTDLPWRYDKFRQPMGRVRRPIPADMLGAFPDGQPLPVTIHLLLARDTIEDKMLLPRLAAAARAAGFFTGGFDVLKTPERALYDGGDLEMGSMLDRDTLISSL